MQPTDKRKMIWISSIIAVLFLGPHLLTFVRYAVFGPPTPYRKPSPAHPSAPAVNVPPVVSAAQGSSPGAVNTVPDAQAAAFLGSWSGGAYLQGASRGLCKLSLEIQRQPGNPPDSFTGYATMTCEPLQTALSPSNHAQALQLLMKGGLNPVSIALSGALDHGSLMLHADRVIGNPQPACPMTAMTVSPFGTGQVSAVWQEQACPGGQLILRRGMR